MRRLSEKKCVVEKFAKSLSALACAWDPVGVVRGRESEARRVACVQH